MNIIRLILLLAAYAFAEGAFSEAPLKSARIGFLGTGPVDTQQPLLDAFRQGLRERGWMEGQNLSIEYRLSDEQTFHRFPSLAAELVARRVDLIVATHFPAAIAAKKATSKIPIVFVTVPDPVAVGLVASLARPGGNITGLTSTSASLGPKRMEILKDALPKMSQAAVLFDANNYEACQFELDQIKSAGKSLGVNVQAVGVGSAAELDRAFSAMSQSRAEALYLSLTPLAFEHRKQILENAAKSRLPVMMDRHDFADEGSVFAFGASYVELYRRAAVYVDKILRGANPATLPVEQPTKFEFVINLKAAKAQDISIPQSLLLRADRVIE